MYNLLIVVLAQLTNYNLCSYCNLQIFMNHEEANSVAFKSNALEILKNERLEIRIRVAAPGQTSNMVGYTTELPWALLL